MPRTRSTVVTEEPAVAPSANGTGEHHVEDLPVTVPSGVRPSERCGTPSPLGIRCEFKEEHTARHSWQPETADEPDQDADLDQAELPGTPEPEKTDYEVPTEASFGKAKLMPAEGLKALGERLIDDDDTLEHLRGIAMRYAWRRRGGTQGGLPRFARIKRPSVWEDYLTGGTVIFLVDLSADHVREHRFTPQQIEAALHEQLCRTDVDPDDHDAYRVVGPDFSGSIRTFDRYGPWKPELREMHAHAVALPLDQALAEVDADEGEESE